MSLPSSWNTVRRTGTWKNFDDGSPSQGDITFDPMRVVTAPEGSGRTIVMPRPRTVALDGNGQIDIELPATDDTDLDSVGWVYKVTERIAPSNRTYFMEAKLSDGAMDMADVVPMVPPPELASTQGPPGKSAYQSWLAVGNTGTEADFVASLGGGSGGPALSNESPAALGAASPGTGAQASRSDHVHPMPSAADVGAATPSQVATAKAEAIATAAADATSKANAAAAASDPAGTATNAVSAHTGAADPHTQYAPKASPALTGVPTAPTAAPGTNTQQIATMAALQAAITALTTTLVDAAPGTLDTLNELAAALGDDPNFATTIAAQIAAKQDGDAMLTALAALVTSADKAIYFTAADTPAIYTISAAGRTFLAAADGPAQLTAIGAEPAQTPVSQPEAEAGAGTVKRSWTVQRVWQAIAAWWAASSAKAKLDGIAAGATANSTDAALLARANHTGTQPLSTLAQSGATTGQVAQWNGSAWVPATVAGGGGSPAGSGTELQYRDSAAFGAATVTAWDAANGRLSIGAGSSPASKLHTKSGSASEIALIGQAAASQTANVQEWRDSSGALMSGIGPNGLIRATNQIEWPTQGSSNWYTNSSGNATPELAFGYGTSGLSNQVLVLNSTQIELRRSIVQILNGATLRTTNASAGGFTIGRSGDTLSFFGGSLTSKPTVSGSRGGNAALASALTALASLGLINDTTTA